jgi:acyl-CoA synthetase (AMP-forming)/AMP-acid ligase II
LLVRKTLQTAGFSGFSFLPGGDRVGDRRLLRERLARYKAPAAVEVGELPNTSTGTAQKNVLREREWAGREKRVN